MRPASLLLPALVLGKLALHLFTLTGYGPHRDEFLYADYGHHLAWGYKEGPPLLGWLAGLSQWAAPASIGALRLWPALFGAATVWLTGRAVQALGGGWFAVLLAGLAVAVAPVYLVMHHLFMQNCLDVFAWTAYGYGLIRFIQAPEPDRPRWLLALGAAIGFGLLSKYTTVFYVLALLPALGLTPLRRWLVRPAFGAAVALALLLVAPNIGWQSTHHWPVVAHMTGLQGGQLTHIAPLNFLLDQVGMTAPGFVLWALGLVFVFGPAGRAYRVLGWHFLLLLTLLLLTHAKNYYGVGVYPILMALGAVALERWTAGVPAALATTTARTAGRWAIRLAVVALVPLGVRRVFPALVPIWPAPRLAAYVAELTKTPMFAGLVRWEDGELHSLPQDVADMFGWPEYAPLVARAMQKLPPAERASVLLVGDNYGPTGACNWFNRAHHLGLPVCHTTNGSYSLWWPEPLSEPAALFYLMEDDEAPDVVPWFRSAEMVGTIRHPYARSRGGQVWLLRGPKPGFGAWARKQIAAARDGFEG